MLFPNAMLPNMQCAVCKSSPSHALRNEIQDGLDTICMLELAMLHACSMQLPSHMHTACNMQRNISGRECRLYKYITAIECMVVFSQSPEVYIDPHLLYILVREY